MKNRMGPEDKTETSSEVPPQNQDLDLGEFGKITIISDDDESLEVYGSCAAYTGCTVCSGNVSLTC